MEWYKDEIRAMEQARISNPPPFGSVVFYGSSSIRLWESLADDFVDVKPTNLGFGGSTLAACAWFFERLVVPYKPRSIVFYAGDNDLGDGCLPDAIVQSFRELLVKVDRYCGPIPFAFLSIKPSPARWHLLDKIRYTNVMIQQELVRRDPSYYIDVFNPMLHEYRDPRPELFIEDGLHLSPAGYRLWVEVVSKYADVIF